MTRDLLELRHEIDAIDDQLLDLLQTRTEIVEEVRTYKKDQHIKIRPSREAEIVYRLFARHKGGFPKTELFRIWREIIVATLRFEGPFSVAVFTNETDTGLWDLARDQYGSFSPMTPMPSARRIIEAVQRQDATLGILPMPTRKEEAPWWRRLVFEEPTSPRIIARLPFVPGGNARSHEREALVICPVEHEATGRDRTYLALESKAQIPSAALTKAFLEVGLPIMFSSDCLDPSRPQVWQTLIEVDGFTTANDPRIKSIEDIFPDKITRVVGLGGYATQITEPEMGV